MMKINIYFLSFAENKLNPPENFTVFWRVRANHYAFLKIEVTRRST